MKDRGSSRLKTKLSLILESSQPTHRVHVVLSPAEKQQNALLYKHCVYGGPPTRGSRKKMDRPFF